MLNRHDPHRQCVCETSISMVQNKYTILHKHDHACGLWVWVKFHGKRQMDPTEEIEWKAKSILMFRQQKLWDSNQPPTKCEWMGKTDLLGIIRIVFLGVSHHREDTTGGILRKGFIETSPPMICPILWCPTVMVINHMLMDNQLICRVLPQSVSLLYKSYLFVNSTIYEVMISFVIS